jgi:hypothetical protein
MELVKQQEPLEFVYKDVTFIIRATATARDKFAVDMCGEFTDGKFVLDRVAFYHKLIQLFVTGWRGVTQDGKDVPYRYDTMMTLFPADPNLDVFLKLGTFIAAETGIFQAADDSKNG